jgi:hypothetical protein
MFSESQSKRNACRRATDGSLPGLWHCIKGHESLAIQEGGMASREFLRVTYGQAADAECRRVREALLEYCGLATLGMLQIVDQLKRLTN